MSERENGVQVGELNGEGRVGGVARGETGAYKSEDGRVGARGVGVVFVVQSKGAEGEEERAADEEGSAEGNAAGARPRGRRGRQVVRTERGRDRSSV